MAERVLASFRKLRDDGVLDLDADPIARLSFERRMSPVIGPEWAQWVLAQLERDRSGRG
jgi:hypothetical protein